MDVIEIIAVSGFVAVMIIGTLGGLVIAFVKATRGSGSSQLGRKESAEETALIQEIHRGLMKMTDRVETLETLLVDEERLKRGEFERELEKD